MMNPMSVLVMMVYLGSMLLVLGVEEWFLVWVGLEVNMMSFLVMIFKSDVSVSEAMGKYFFVQSLGSGCLIGMMYLGWSEIVWGMVLMLKMGVGVFYYWYVSVVKVLSWGGVYLMSVIQSIVPMLLVGEMVSWIVFLGGVVSVIVGVWGVYGQMVLKVLVGFSSVYHYGWLFGLMAGGGWAWMVYLAVYAMVMSQVIVVFVGSGLEGLMGLEGFRSSSAVVLGMLSLAGLPPLFGFFLKWLAFVGLLSVDVMIAGVYMVTSVIMMYVYLRVLYSVMMNSIKGCWFAYEMKVSGVGVEWWMMGGVAAVVLGVFM